MHVSAKPVLDGFRSCPGLTFEAKRLDCAWRIEDDPVVDARLAEEQRAILSADRRKPSMIFAGPGFHRELKSQATRLASKGRNRG